MSYAPTAYREGTSTVNGFRPASLRRLAIVDDDRDLLELMRELLADVSWESTPITAASRAFDRLVTLMPDGIVLDLHLESPDAGWRVLEQIRGDPRTRGIPVIVWSADLRQLDQKRDWLDEHGIPVLVKPFDVDDLLVLLERIPGTSTEDRSGAAN